MYGCIDILIWINDAEGRNYFAAFTAQSSVVPYLLK
jgi:hypothetical protein